MRSSWPTRSPRSPVAAGLNYFRLTRAEYFVPVSVRVPARELALNTRRGARTLIDVIGEVKDDHGVTHRNVRDNLELRLPADSPRFADQPVQYETGFTLLPGRYVIKLLIRDGATGRIGTYESPFEVPNLDREDRRLAISSVVLSGQQLRSGDAAHRVRQKERDAADPLVHEGARWIPSVSRAFRLDRDLLVFLQAYPSGVGVAPVSVAGVVTLFHGERMVLETPPLVVTEPPDARSKGLSLHFCIPLGTLSPGLYECGVMVLAPELGRAAFWHAPIVLVR